MGNFNLEEIDDVLRDLKNCRDYFDSRRPECLAGVEAIKALQTKVKELEAASQHWKKQWDAACKDIATLKEDKSDE